MVVYYDCMTYSNVISKRYIMKKEQFESAQKSFLEDVIVRDKLCITGVCFYMVEDVKDGTIAVWFMIPIAGDTDLIPKEYKYDSYFSLERAVCCRLSAEELNQKNSSIFNTMRGYCLKDGLDISTPVFFVPGTDEEEPYFSLYAGIAPKEIVIINDVQ